MPYYEPANLGSNGLIRFGTWISARGTRYGPRVWPHHQMIWIIDGSATVDAEGETFAAPPGAVFHFPTGLEYVITWDARRPTRLGYADFLPDDPAGLPRIRNLEGDDIVMSLLNHMVWLLTEQPPDWTESARIAFDYVLRAYRSGFSGTRVGLDGVYSELITRATIVMQGIWEDGALSRLSLPDLADALGVSSRHLSRVFGEELGVGPVTTFRMFRVLEGARMLTDTSLPIREISRLVGFANEFHFSRVFKATVGVPPAEYRARPVAATAVPPHVEHVYRILALHTPDTATTRASAPPE